jgi:poly(A) polymerase Pap1
MIISCSSAHRGKQSMLVRCHNGTINSINGSRVVSKILLLLHQHDIIENLHFITYWKRRVRKIKKFPRKKGAFTGLKNV